MRLEPYLIRFQSRPDSILEQFFLQNGRSFRIEVEPGSFTEPKRDTRGRLDLNWNRFGSVLGQFLVNILIHEPALTIEWDLPIRHRAMGSQSNTAQGHTALWTCASGHVRMDMCVRTCAYGHVRLDMCVWTCAYGHVRLDMCVWTCASGHVRLDMCI